MTIRNSFLFWSIAFLVSGNLLAQNLVPNSSFDSVLSPWTPMTFDPSDFTFSTADANGSKKSGSAHIVLAYQIGRAHV